MLRSAESVDECVPCLSEEVEQDILSSTFDHFHDAVAPFDCTESVSGSSSSLQSSFLQYFSPRAACYAYRDVHDFVAQTGKPHYLVARVPVPSTLHISTWRELLQNYQDSIVCDFLEFGWPVGFMPTTLPVFDLRTHRGALLFSEQVTAYLTRKFLLAGLPVLLTSCHSSMALWFRLLILYPNGIRLNAELLSI